MALYGRTYQFTQFEQVVIEAEDETQAAAIFSELERSAKYKYDILCNWLTPHDAWEYITDLEHTYGEELWDAESYGYDEPTTNASAYNKED